MKAKANKRNSFGKQLEDINALGMRHKYHKDHAQDCSTFKNKFGRQIFRDEPIQGSHGTNKK